MDTMFPTFSSFEKAALHLVKNTPTFAASMEELFAKNDWHYSFGATRYYKPDKASLTALTLSLINSAMNQKRNKCAFASSGRITVKIFRVGKTYHPMMYCDSFAV